MFDVVEACQIFYRAIESLCDYAEIDIHFLFSCDFLPTIVACHKNGVAEYACVWRAECHILDFRRIVGFRKGVNAVGCKETCVLPSEIFGLKFAAVVGRPVIRIAVLVENDWCAIVGIKCDTP